MSVLTDSELAPFSDGPHSNNDRERMRTTTYFTDSGQTVLDEISERIWRTLVSCVVPSGAILFAIDFHLNASFTEIVAIVMLCIFLSTTFRLLWLIYRATNMYRICSRSQIVPNWTTMPVAYKIMEFKKEAIHSISEFSAISGGGNITSMLTMAENIWLMMLALFIYKMTASLSLKPDIDNLNTDDIFMLIGVFGLLLQSIWQFNDCSLIQKGMHFIGVICWSMVIVAYGWQTDWNYMFCTLLSLFITLFIVWMFISMKASKYNGDQAKTVNCYSKLMLICELCFMWQSIIALILWVYYHSVYYPIQS